MLKRSDIRIVVQTRTRRWATVWPSRAADARALIGKALELPEFSKKAEGVVEIELIDDPAMRALNGQFRATDKATNVLSFTDSVVPFGAIALSLGTIEAEAGAQGKPFVNHAKHLLLHGFLHLVGYDHETIKERRLMERHETRMLASMGIANPYLPTDI